MTLKMAKSESGVEFSKNRHSGTLRGALKVSGRGPVITRTMHAIFGFDAFSGNRTQSTNFPDFGREMDRVSSMVNKW